MSIELKEANTALAITQEGDPIRIEITASGIDPVGSVKPAVRSFIGIASTLKYVAGSETIAGAISAIPDKCDRSFPVEARIGWCAEGNTGFVKWRLLYKWTGVDTLLIGAEDGQLTELEEVRPIASGYAFTSFTIPAPSSTDRVLIVQIHREGADIEDTCISDAHLVGMLFEYKAGVN